MDALTNNGSEPILFADKPSDAPQTISENGKKIARIVTLLESKKFFGNLTIDFGGEVKKLSIKQELRI